LNLSGADDIFLLLRAKTRTHHRDTESAEKTAQVKNIDERICGACLNGLSVNIDRAGLGAGNLSGSVVEEGPGYKLYFGYNVAYPKRGVNRFLSNNPPFAFGGNL
jgi:hypothetical protein